MVANEASVYRMVMTFAEDGTPEATLDFQRGTSEDPSDPHFGDQNDSWVTGTHAPLAFREADVEARATARSVLSALHARSP
jgi:penicillin amidase